MRPDRSGRWQWEWRWSSRRGDDWSLRTLVARYLVILAGLFLVGQWVRGVHVGDWQALLVAGAILTAVHTLVRPVLSAVTCLVQVLTLGLFTLILNTLMLALTAWVAGQLDVNFDVDGFRAAFLGALLVSATSMLLTGPVRRALPAE